MEVDIEKLAEEFRYYLRQLIEYCEDGRSLRQSFTSVEQIAKKTVERQHSIWGKANPRERPKERGLIWPFLEVINAQMDINTPDLTPRFSFAVGDNPFILNAVISGSGDGIRTSQWDWIDIRFDDPLEEWNLLASRIRENSNRWIEYCRQPDALIRKKSAGAFHAVVVPFNEGGGRADSSERTSGPENRRQKEEKNRLHGSLRRGRQSSGTHDVDSPSVGISC